MRAFSPHTNVYLEGVGFVSSGPRQQTSSSGATERIVRLSTGSEAVVPRILHRPGAFRLTGEQLFPPRTESLVPATIKQEDVTDEESTFINDNDHMVQDDAGQELSDMSSMTDWRGSFAAMLTGFNAGNRTRGHRGERQNPHSSTRSRRSGPVSVEADSVLPWTASNTETTSAEAMQTFSNERESEIFSVGSGSSTRSNSVDAGSLSTDPSEQDSNASHEACTCPISVECSHRPEELLDHRPLVGEWDVWPYSQEEEAFERHRIARSRGERFCTTTDLARIVDIIKKAQNPTDRTPGERLEHEFRSWIESMADVTLTPGEQQAVATNQVIPSLNDFLIPPDPAVSSALDFPDYIGEELKVLQIKWTRGDFSGNIDRGLIEKGREDMNGTVFKRTLTVDPSWAYYKQGSFFGQGDLVNGQIFLNRVHLMRDGVHAPRIAGISGRADEGAFSIVLGAFDEKKNKGYADVDMGDEIEYMGTALKPDEKPISGTNVVDEDMDDGVYDASTGPRPTSATRALMTSLTTGKPVRVIRSFRMCCIVKNKPKKGYRYDGLYRVKSYKCMKKDRQIWTFRLHRCEGQGRLRGFAPGQEYPYSSRSRRGHPRTRKGR